MAGPTERFTEVAKNYARYRPAYPSQLLSRLVDACQLKPSHTIADIGSGTGLLTRLFLENGNTVYGVEPNRAMRVLGEDLLKPYPNFHSVDGSAEVTHLPDQAVDFITAGTAFHWFDKQRARLEFQRILRNNGFVILIWNVRDHDHSPLMHDYEKLLHNFSSLPDDAREWAFEKTVSEHFFRGGTLQKFIIPNQQSLDWESFCGRLLSTSYVFKPTHPNYQTMLDALQSIYERYQRGGFVEMQYRTEVSLGRL